MDKNFRVSSVKSKRFLFSFQKNLSLRFSFLDHEPINRTSPGRFCLIGNSEPTLPFFYRLILPCEAFVFLKGILGRLISRLPGFIGRKMAN